MYRVMPRPTFEVPRRADDDGAASVLVQAERQGGVFDCGTNETYGRFADDHEVFMVIADGVRANDRACIELAIRFIELFFMGSYAGHVLARRLQSASLSAQDRARLADRFFDLVAHAELGAVRQNLAALWRIVSASKAATTEPADARRDGHRVTLVQRLLRDLRPLRRPAFAGV